MCPAESEVAAAVSPSMAVEMKRAAAGIATQGVKIADFGVGQPDFNAPPAVEDAAVESIRAGRGKYVDPQGLLELREQIVAFEADRHRFVASAEQVVVTPGSYGALSIVMRAILEHPFEALVLGPAWGPYESIIRLTGAVAKKVPMQPGADGRFSIDIVAIEAEITANTRAIIVNSPWNPCGRVLSVEELRALGEIAIRYDLWIISDEIYSEIIFDGRQHQSIATLGGEIAERCIVINSLSKSFAMTGWRLGYCIAPLRLAPLLSRINQYSSRCATSFVQYAGIVALRDCINELESMRIVYEERRNKLVDGLNRIPGLCCPKPEGTFYAFAKVDSRFGNSQHVARTLLHDGGVIVMPGGSYGIESDGFLRLSFATDIETIEFGVRQMAKVFDTSRF